MIFTLLKFHKNSLSSFWVTNRNFGGILKPGPSGVNSSKKVEEIRVKKLCLLYYFIFRISAPKIIFPIPICFSYLSSDYFEEIYDGIYFCCFLIFPSKNSIRSSNFSINFMKFNKLTIFVIFYKLINCF